MIRVRVGLEGHVRSRLIRKWCYRSRENAGEKLDRSVTCWWGRHALVRIS